MTEHFSSIEHLSSTVLNALVDGELSVEQATAAKEHLDHCSACTSTALQQALLKTATAKAGQRYELPSQLEQRLRRVASSQAMDAPISAAWSSGVWSSSTWSMKRGLTSALAVAATLLVVAMSWAPLRRHMQESDFASAQQAALVAEVFDQHVATLAANQPPEVISSDRHTVKPWFQGRIPFSFNLPDNLPNDTKLDGANLTYLHNRPVAQLLYSIGRHHVSVFVQEKSGAPQQEPAMTEHSGFHIVVFHAGDLQVIAVSDVDPARLSSLVRAIEQAQAAR
jgi:anti-sigma factor RsiW